MQRNNGNRSQLLLDMALGKRKGGNNVFTRRKKKKKESCDNQDNLNDVTSHDTGFSDRPIEKNKTDDVTVDQHVEMTRREQASAESNSASLDYIGRDKHEIYEVTVDDHVEMTRREQASAESNSASLNYNGRDKHEIYEVTIDQINSDANVVEINKPIPEDTTEENNMGTIIIDSLDIKNCNINDEDFLNNLSENNDNNIIVIYDSSSKNVSPTPNTFNVNNCVESLSQPSNSDLDYTVDVSLLNIIPKVSSFPNQSTLSTPECSFTPTTENLISSETDQPPSNSLPTRNNLNNITSNVSGKLIDIEYASLDTASDDDPDDPDYECSFTSISGNFNSSATDQLSPNSPPTRNNFKDIVNNVSGKLEYAPLDAVFDDDPDDPDYVESETQKTSKDAGLKQQSKRWKKSNPLSWKVNINKENRLKGLPYESKTGVHMKAKVPRKSCLNCRYKCSEIFSEQERKGICQRYHSMTSYERQKDFLISLVNEENVQRRRVRNDDSSKGKEKSRRYYFLKDGEKKRVCKKFFVGTLCISHGPIDTALANKNEDGVFHGSDKRGRKEPGNKTSVEKALEVKLHIESFPVMESHYCRKKSKRKYLDQNLSITKMYDLYVKTHESPVSEITYRRIFCNDYNLSFYVPKKDQCLLCTNYKKASIEEKEALSAEYEKHIELKDAALNSKAVDKIRAAEDEHFTSASFDLQSVLQIPSADVSPLYYSRKLCAYNLSVYEAADPNRAFCYCWSEINGQRGSNEIGTSLFNYFKSLPERINEISLYSDTCSGQNRNKFIASLLVFIVQTFDNIKIIQHNFFEKGHSLMEADSIHSAIESAKKYVSVYLMHDWINIMKVARSKRNKNKTKDPYIVSEFKYNDFFDLRNLAKLIIPNNMRSENNEKIRWLKIKRMRYVKEKPNSIFISYDYSSSFLEMKLKTSSSQLKKVNMTKVYSNHLPISAAKKADLVTLCKKGVIPSEYHNWYNGLPTSKNKTDRLPEPSLSEDES